MKDDEIQVFIANIHRYFESLDEDDRVVIEPPFLRDHPEPLLEYTGVINISGRVHGIVCFTANSPMLRQILSLLDEPETGETAKRDLVGEIANTLSGNAREQFGSDFRISVPFMMNGSDQFPKRQQRSYVVPVNWHGQTAYLLVCLAEGSKGEQHGG